MKIAISITDYSWPGPAAEIHRRLGEVAAAAEAAGLDALWVADHLLQADPGLDMDAEMLEAYSTLSWLAALTSRIDLGAMVSPVTYRAPALLLKTVTTLDVLSAGRARLGLGAGYQTEEAAAMGLDLPGSAARYAQLEDVLELAEQTWAGSGGQFHGCRNELERPMISPPPVRRPPILIGGMGEKRTLPLVARHADACNLFDIPDGGATLRRKLEVLADACAAVGRDPAEVERTVSTRFESGADLEQFVDHCRELAALGIDTAVVISGAAWQPNQVARLGEAAEALR